jgi:hypothetical protein
VEEKARDRKGYLAAWPDLIPARGRSG